MVQLGTSCLPPQVVFVNKVNPKWGARFQKVQTILTTYQEAVPIKVVEDFNSKHLLPWFSISKKKGGHQMETVGI